MNCPQEVCNSVASKESLGKRLRHYAFFLILLVLFSSQRWIGLFACFQMFKLSGMLCFVLSHTYGGFYFTNTQLNVAGTEYNDVLQ